MSSYWFLPLHPLTQCDVKTPAQVIVLKVRACRLILKFLGVITKVDTLVGIKVNVLLLGRLLCGFVSGGRTTEKVFLVYSRLLNNVRFIFFISIGFQTDNLIVFLVFVWRVMVIIIVVCILRGVSTIKGILLIVVVTTLILWMLSLLVSVIRLISALWNRRIHWYLIYIFMMKKLDTWHSVQIVPIPAGWLAQ